MILLIKGKISCGGLGFFLGGERDAQKNKSMVLKIATGNLLCSLQLLYCYAINNVLQLSVELLFLPRAGAKKQ